jgi:uncharacterized membrane protein (UPF0136 family)
MSQGAEVEAGVPTWERGPAAALGALVALGGTIGFVKSRSRPSLIAGSLIGGGFASCAYGLGADKSPTTQRRAANGALLLSSLTAMYMGKKALYTHRNVLSMKVLAGGKKYIVYSYHRQPKLMAYLKPGGIKWMPGGVVCVASTATAGFYSGVTPGDIIGVPGRASADGAGIEATVTSLLQSWLSWLRSQAAGPSS